MKPINAKTKVCCFNVHQGGATKASGPQLLINHRSIGYIRVVYAKLSTLHACRSGGSDPTWLMKAHDPSLDDLTGRLESIPVESRAPRDASRAGL